MSDFDKLVNEACREVREFRDRLIGRGNELPREAIEAMAKKEIRTFWDRQPWWMQWARKPVMKLLYQLVKKLL